MSQQAAPVESPAAFIASQVSRTTASPWSPPVRLLKDDRTTRSLVIDKPDTDADESAGRIRCPLCDWQPMPADRWRCAWSHPEPLFSSCDTVWNTFLTHGRCPGCGHQWEWTSCLQCGGWSLHDDWYGSASDRDGAAS